MEILYTASNRVFTTLQDAQQFCSERNIDPATILTNATGEWYPAQQPKQQQQPYKYYRITSNQLMHEIMTGNRELEKSWYTHADADRDLLYIRHETNTDALEGSFSSDPMWRDVSFDEDFLESLAPYMIEEAEVKSA